MPRAWRMPERIPTDRGIDVCAPCRIQSRSSRVLISCVTVWKWWIPHSEIPNLGTRATVSEQGRGIPPDSKRKFRRVRRHVQMRVPADEQRRVPIRDGSPRYRDQRVRESEGSRILDNEFQRHGIRAEGGQADARVTVNVRFAVPKEVRKAALFALLSFHPSRLICRAMFRLSYPKFALRIAD